MAFDSFADFLNRLEAAGELKRHRPTGGDRIADYRHADREMKKPGGGQALLFEKPTVNGRFSRFRWPSMLGSHKRMAMSIGADSVEQAR